MLHVLLGFETVSPSTCRCILQVNVLFREPFFLFTNFHNILGVLFEVVCFGSFYYNIVFLFMCFILICVPESYFAYGDRINLFVLFLL
jgi:hypothetical protein